MIYAQESKEMGRYLQGIMDQATDALHCLDNLHRHVPISANPNASDMPCDWLVHCAIQSMSDGNEEES
jgi:hypothetical protein